MKLANKTFLIIAVTLGIILVVQVYLAREILMSGFEKLEHRDAVASVERFRDALREQVDSLAIKVVDWSMWDDAYEYVHNRNQEFEKSNLEDNTLINLKVQLFIFLDAKNAVVYGKMVDPQGEVSGLSPAVRNHLQSHPSLYRFRNGDHHVNGLVLMDGQPMLISSQPIIKSDGSGPIGGTIIVGRSLDAAAIAKLSQLIHLAIQVAPVGRELPAEFSQAAMSLREAKDIAITVTDDALITGYLLYDDLYGDQCLYVAVRIPRDVHRQAKATMVAFLATMVIGGMLLMLITSWAMNRSVVRPIIRLNKKIHVIGEEGNVSMRVSAEGEDEIASLAGEVNQMLGHLEESKSSMQRLLDNTKQGFLIFGPDGLIANDFSRAVLDIFGENPAGRHVAGLLREDQRVWEEYSQVLFAEELPFAELIVLCPRLIQLNGRFIELGYIDIRNQQQRITHIMVVATDVTALRLLMKEKEDESSRNRMLIKILAAKNDFLVALSMLHGLQQCRHDLLEFRRRLHTLKGCFNTLACVSFAESCQQWEERLAQEPTPETAQAAQHAITEQVNRFVDHYDSLLKIRSTSGTTRTLASQEIHQVIAAAVEHGTAPVVIEQLRQMVEMPAPEALGWLDDAFMAAAAKAGKEALPALWLPSATIDPDPYLGLLRSLVHIPRNAADHGLEDPDAREALGKPRAGRLTMQLTLMGETYTLLIADDGAGVDIAKVTAKAVAMGLPEPQSKEEALALLFNDGLSTKDTVTDLSGWGVGMSAVRSEAGKLGGEVRIDSSAGHGTRISVLFQRQGLWLADNRSIPPMPGVAA